MGVNIQTIKEIKLYINGELKGTYSDYEITALTGIIIKTVLKSSVVATLALPETRISKKQLGRIVHICRELKAGKPLQYILGETDFFNCLIRVNSDTLIPRPETEEMVDLIIKENKRFTGSILDVGTGSGCIAIALAINLPGSSVTGIDISEGAIHKAKENAGLNNAKVVFCLADILNIDPGSFAGTDIIVSNPPYILDSEKRLMERNVLDYEPHSALFVPETDPLKYYSAIIRLASGSLVNGGKIYLEINEAMGSQIYFLLESSGYSPVEIFRDLNGKERIVKGIRHD